MAATHPAQDIMKADPIATLNRVSNISLQGGGTFLAAVGYAVYKINTTAWKVDIWVLLVGLIGAILLALAAALVRVYEAKLRVRLTLKLLEQKGTGDAEVAKTVETIIPSPGKTPVTVNVLTSDAGL
jgi:hypothetical protein